jgi:hypothetical protein
MKRICVLGFLISAVSATAQFEYGTALVPGSITISQEETREEYCNNVLRVKSETRAQYSTSLNGVVYWTNDNLKMIRMFPPKNGLQGTMMYFNNFTQTLPEGATGWDGKNYNIPLYPITGNYEGKQYGKDPCIWTPECEPDFTTVLNGKKKYSGPVTHHGHSGGNFRVSIEGIQNCGAYLFLRVNTAGTFIENGTPELASLHGEDQNLIAKTTDDGCKWEWDKVESKKMMNVEYEPQQDQYSDKKTDDRSWIGSNGVYSRYEVTDEGDGVRYEMRENVTLMRIDTATLFSYLRNRPSMQSFSMAGNYESESNDGYQRTVTKIRYQATFTIGKKPGFTIEAENKEDYEKWLPGNQDYADSFEPVSFKASFEDKKQTDTISFSLLKITHLPGICCNYPILGDKPAKEEPDIYFAPQDKQTDQNIKILNDSVASTTKRVNEATIVVYSRDFGGHAILQARSFFSSDVALCPYDDDYSIEIPNDQDQNCIADAWEKEMGVYGIDRLDDKDKLPSGINREGDGLTAFEEYRGFICDKDVIASCDGGHTKRSGKHVRTSPLCRDIFIYDADGLFAKYGAAANPAECHWHYLNAEQVKLPPADQVSAVIKANETDEAGEGDVTVGYVKTWIDKDFRRINKNTPDTLRNNKQFAMYLLLSPLASSNGGNTIFYGDATGSSPLQYGHLVVLPQFESFRKVQTDAVDGLIKNSNNNLAEKYPPEVVAKLLQTVYEAMVVHEMGHGLGMDHHKKGVITVINTKTKEKLLLTKSDLGKVTDGVQYNEVFYLDGNEYLITSPEFALNAMGVSDCCMRYTMEREVDFIDMKVLQKSMKYCKKGQKFTNGDGSKTDADDCFGTIKVRCMP